ncbi:MAG: hypothetical protein K5668_07080 [Lachnospiraceae bacterium]|nr:hypothetical protein [Lachnospiraceae bacterium]
MIEITAMGKALKDKYHYICRILAAFMLVAFFSAAINVLCFAEISGLYGIGVSNSSQSANPLSVNAVGWIKDSTYFLTHVGIGKNISARFNGPDLDMAASGVSANTIISLKHENASGYLIYEKTFEQLAAVGGGDVVLNAGSYLVTIKYSSGGHDYQDTASFSVTDSSSTADPVILYDGKSTIAAWYRDKVIISAAGYTVADSQSGPFESSYVFKGDSKNVSKTLYFKSDSTGTIRQKAAGPVNFDTKAPAGSIKIKDKSWKNVQTDKEIYEYTNESRKASIDGEDESSGSGLDKKYYYISTKSYDSESSVKDHVGTQWKTYSSKVSLKENKLNYVYAKITDKAGNETYLSSEGIWYDRKNPVVSSVAGTASDTGASVTIKGTDGESGIANYYCSIVKKGDSTPSAASLKSGGKKSTDGVFDFSGLTSGTTYTIYAVTEDKAGNLSAVKTGKLTVGGEAAKKKLTSASSTGDNASGGKSTKSKTSGKDSVSGSSAKVSNSKKSGGSGSGSKKTGSSSKKTGGSGKKTGGSGKKTTSGNGKDKSTSGNSLSKNETDSRDAKKTGSWDGQKDTKAEKNNKDPKTDNVAKSDIEGKAQRLKASAESAANKKSVSKNKENKPVNIGRMLLVMAFFIGIAVFVWFRFRKVNDQ